MSEQTPMKENRGSMTRWKKKREDTPFPTRSLTRYSTPGGRRPHLAKIDTNRSVASFPLSFPEVGEYVTVASRSDVEEALASGVRGISLQESAAEDTDGDDIVSDASPMNSADTSPDTVSESGMCSVVTTSEPIMCVDSDASTVSSLPASVTAIVGSPWSSYVVVEEGAVIAEQCWSLFHTRSYIEDIALNPSTVEVNGRITVEADSTVASARDVRTDRPVTVRVIRDGHPVPGGLSPWSVSEYVAYDNLRRAGGCRVDRFVEVLGVLPYGRHACIVMDDYGPSLRDLLVVRDVTLQKYVREIAKQVLQGVEYLHSLQLIHTDIRPDNIVMASGDRLWVAEMRGGEFQDECRYRSYQVKITNLQATKEVHERWTHNTGVSEYRSPEGCLGLPGSYPVDLFAVGLVISELYLGRSLLDYDGIDDMTRLYCMRSALGPFPYEFRQLIQSVKWRMEKENALSDRTRIRGFQSLDTRRSRIRSGHRVDSADQNQSGDRRASISMLIGNSLLLDVLRGLLRYHHQDRFSASQALKQAYFWG